MEDEQHDQRREPANGEIDVEAPASGNVLGESAADDGADDAGNGKGGVHGAGPHGSFMQRDDGREDDHPARKDAGRAEPGDGPPHDENGRRGRQGTHQASDFKQRHRTQIDDLLGEEHEEFAGQRLARAAVGVSLAVE